VRETGKRLQREGRGREREERGGGRLEEAEAREGKGSYLIMLSTTRCLSETLETPTETPWPPWPTTAFAIAEVELVGPALGCGDPEILLGTTSELGRGFKKNRFDGFSH
jgi:hypothetical protein